MRVIGVLDMHGAQFASSFRLNGANSFFDGVLLPQPLTSVNIYGESDASGSARCNRDVPMDTPPESTVRAH